MDSQVKDKPRILLGIDPGTTIMGYGILTYSHKNFQLLAMGVIKLGKLDDHYVKLQRIFERTLSLIDEFHPDEMAIEAPFYGKNVQSMLKLGRAQGVAIAAALYRSLPVHEYSPRKIKQAITGNGAASKEQVSAMLSNLMPIKQTPESLDATDGLAAAVCHALQQFPAVTSKAGGWEGFLRDNPQRIRKR